MNIEIKPSNSEIQSLYNYFVNKNFYEAEKLSLIFTEKFPNFQKYEIKFLHYES